MYTYGIFFKTAPNYWNVFPCMKVQATLLPRFNESRRIGILTTEPQLLFAFKVESNVFTFNSVLQLQASVLEAGWNRVHSVPDNAHIHVVIGENAHIHKWSKPAISLHYEDYEAVKGIMGMSREAITAFARQGAWAATASLLPLDRS